MSAQTYYLIHFIAIFLLTAFSFLAIGAADKGKSKGMMAWTGILSLVSLVGGFGLMAKLEYEYTEPWVHVKIAAWLVITLLAGFAYRKPQARSLWVLLGTLSVAAVAYALYVMKVSG